MSNNKDPLKCPECGLDLKTDSITPRLFWCVNTSCKLFCRRLRGFFLMFEKDASVLLTGAKE